jgi:hypothetical protein
MLEVAGSRSRGLRTTSVRPPLSSVVSRSARTFNRSVPPPLLDSCRSRRGGRLSFAKTPSARCVWRPLAGMLPFSCPSGATRCSKRQQGVAQSESRKSPDSTGDGARLDDVQQTAAKGGQRFFFRLRTRRSQVRVLQGAPLSLCEIATLRSRGWGGLRTLPFSSLQHHPAI